MGVTAQSKPDEAVADVNGEPAEETHASRLTISRAYVHAQRNIRRHGLRDAQRMLVLIVADLSTFAVLWQVLHGLRGGWLGSRAAAVTSELFAPGFLGGLSEVAVVLAISLFISGAYGAGQRRRDTGRVLMGVSLAGFVSLYASAWHESLPLAVVRFAATVTVITPILMGVRLGVDRMVRRVRREPASRAVLVSHAGADLDAIGSELRAIREFRVVDSVRLGNGKRRSLEAALASFERVIERAKADTVLLWTDLTPEEFHGAVDLALASGCRLLSTPRTQGAVAIQPRAVWMDGVALVELSAPGLKAWQLVAKRIIDLSAATAGLLVLSPLLLVVALWVKLDSPGPVLFGQTRVGVRGRAFRMLKFRSMRADAEEMLSADSELNRLFHENGFKIPADLDPRLTRSGRVLRKTSIDEMPQLLNVLAGSMSLVGPRPIERVELEHSGHHYGRHGMPVFLSVKPGITGAWAVNGRSSVGYPDRAQLELDYIRSWSIGSDLMLLLRTLPAILSRRGAH